MRNNACCKIQTPEGVVFRLYPAGPARRMAAFILDSMMLAAIIAVVNNFIPIFSLFSPTIAYAIILAADFCLGILYWIFSEWLLNGKTIGKKVFKLRVVDSNGLKLLPQQIIIRNLLRSVDFLPMLYAVGSISCFFDRQVRRLGDIAAGTIVIRDIQPSAPDLSSVLPDKYNSLRDYPLEAARLRDKITPEEGGLLLDALRRRNQLNPKDRYHVYADLATHFKGKVKFPAIALDGMSDEKFLRNLIDIIYQH